MSLKTRIKRLEARCGIVEEQPEVIDLGDGVCFTMTRSEFARLLREISASKTSRILPRDDPPPEPTNHTEDELTPDPRYGSDPCPNDREKSV